MLQVHDIRESRIYQEARQEGKAEGKVEGKAEGLIEGEENGFALAIAKMAANKMSADQIAAILEWDIEKVRAVLGDSSRRARN